MPISTSNQADKVLVSLFALSKQNNKTKFALEDAAVKVWKDHPKEFCLRGYIEHPDVERIRRVISKLTSIGYVIGNVSGYSLTTKGIEYAQKLGVQKSNSKIVETAEASRKLHSAMERLVNSKIFREFLIAKNNSKKIDLLQSDFFEFLGTSPRSLGTLSERNQIFLPKYKFMIEEILPFCEKNAKTDRNAALLLELWLALFDKFGALIKSE